MLYDTWLVLVFFSGPHQIVIFNCIWTAYGYRITVSVEAL